jgi:hypothetical protein
MKFAADRPLADPEKAARRIIEIASTVEPAQDGRIFVELINGPFLFKDKGSPAEYGAGMALAIERGWLLMHESGTYVRFTPASSRPKVQRACHRQALSPTPRRLRREVHSQPITRSRVSSTASCFGSAVAGFGSAGNCTIRARWPTTRSFTFTMVPSGNSSAS